MTMSVPSISNPFRGYLFMPAALRITPREPLAARGIVDV